MSQPTRNKRYMTLFVARLQSPVEGKLLRTIKNVVFVIEAFEADTSQRPKHSRFQISDNKLHSLH